MTARLLDGLATATAIKTRLTSRVEALRAAGVTPGLGTLLVGTDPGSQWYVAGKHRDCAEVGMASIRRDLPESATQSDVETVIDELNADPEVTGYIVQLPLPEHIDTDAILERIDPAKDADGLHPTNLGDSSIASRARSSRLYRVLRAVSSNWSNTTDCRGTGSMWSSSAGGSRSGDRSGRC